MLDTTKTPLSGGNIIQESFHEVDWTAGVLEAKGERDRRAREYRRHNYKVLVSGGDNPFGGPRVWFLVGYFNNYAGPKVYSSDDYSRIKPLAND